MCNYTIERVITSPLPPLSKSHVRNVDFDIQRQLLSVFLSTFNKWPPNHSLVPPHDVVDGENQPELEPADESEQEAFHPVEHKNG